MDTLPPYKQITKQLEIMELLTSYRHDCLGCYGPEDMAMLTQYERTRLGEFQATLDKVEKRINARNKLRRVPYPYLLPSLVPNSTSV